ncbi:30S ribosomal protein S19 [Candidatus Pacearchaeota archaeon]|nr:30S ribosomal protein S19 [Candidatus Pacearchaeota archaeon]
MVVGKEFTYQGKKLEELKQLSLSEFANLLPSRERRTILRSGTLIEKFLKRCNKKSDKEKNIRTHNRDIIIVPKLVGLTISIHNGKEFTQIIVTEEMIGHRLGEFTQTRSRVQHGAPGIGATRGSAFLSVK